MSVLLIVGPKCTLAASHSARWWVTVSMLTRRKDGRTPNRYVTLSCRRGQHNNKFISERAECWSRGSHCLHWCLSLQRSSDFSVTSLALLLMKTLRCCCDPVAPAYLEVTPGRPYRYWVPLSLISDRWVSIFYTHGRRHPLEKTSVRLWTRRRSRRVCNEERERAN